MFDLIGLLSELFKLSNVVITINFIVQDVQASEHDVLQAVDNRGNVILLVDD